jgi:glyoxylase-like metal-dependent hydrolase (beta-lactamase superfamily II)
MTIFKPTRRQILEAACLAPVLALPASAATNVLAPARPQSTGAYRFRIGQAQVTILSDGNLNIPVSGLGVNAEPAEVQKFLTDHALSAQMNYAHTNHVLVEMGDIKLLVDVGSGDRFQDSVGRLVANMEAAGVDPADITHVFITHAHPDHVWGIRDDFDEPVFSEAQYIIGAKEYDWWMTDDRANMVDPSLQQFVVGAVNALSTEGIEWTVAQDNYEIAPGLRVIDTPGHTLGHMSLVIESDGQSLIALGDCMSHAYMSVEQPKWVNDVDMDKEATVATRLRLLDMAATDGMAVLGYHFPFPGVGRIMADTAGGYRFIPALWRWQDAG